MEECLTVTQLQGTSSGERRKSQENVGSVSQPPSSQPSDYVEINVACTAPEIIDHPTTGARVSSTGNTGVSVEEEDVIPEPEDIEVSYRTMTFLDNIKKTKLFTHLF